MMGMPTQQIMSRKIRGEVMEKSMAAKLENLQQLHLEGLLTSEEVCFHSIVHGQQWHALDFYAFHVFEVVLV